MDAAEKFHDTYWIANDARRLDTTYALSAQSWIVQHIGTTVGRVVPRTSFKLSTSDSFQRRV
ncbi:hypothetical protein M407DRAFT_170187 [Tulasnella calospora MUT 4182]|uniref:Uncharacterized protein n=1 Tax=Tulasnella calospora MUT 4182 TaxID=1051891 RepID=A0A0C3K846_9AGAM|nr:hypothetical protein M407DRAFT_170187 [Tulasnella calospora MUT 4182]